MRVNHRAMQMHFALRATYLSYGQGGTVPHVHQRLQHSYNTAPLHGTRCGGVLVHWLRLKTLQHKRMRKHVGDS